MNRRIFNNPLSSNRVDQVLALIDVNEEATVLDVGCGRGEMLARISERSGCRVVGVDIKQELISAATGRLAAIGDKALLHCCAAKDMHCEHQTFDAALCVGSTHAFGEPPDGLPNTLAGLKALVCPDGFILVGEGYWKQAPSDEYLETTGIKRTDFNTHERNVAVGEELGLKVLYVTASSLEEWDPFESLTWMMAEDAVHERPNDADAQKRVEHWRRWRRAYLLWGRDTLGFGVYLFRK